MRKLFPLPLIAACLLYAQTSNYPGSVDTASQLFVARDNVQTYLTVAMAPGDNVAIVASTAGFAANMIATVCDQVSTTSANGSSKCVTWEHMLVTGVSGQNVVQVSRGFNGTAAAAHAMGLNLSAAIDAAHHQALSSAVMAIENALGPNLSNIAADLPTLATASYNFTPQQPGGTVSPGANVITLSPCPKGVNGTDTAHYLYVSGGTGAAEPVLITGGTCTSGASSGTVIVAAANSHSGAWTIGPASFGLAEAVVTGCAAGGASITIAGGTFTPHATVTVPCSGIRISGQGPNTTIIRRTEDYGNTITLAEGISDNEISDLQLLHYNGFTYGAAPSSCVNQTPAHPAAAHVESNNCVKCRTQNLWLYNMPYGLKINGGALSRYEQTSTLGTWDYANAGCQYSIAGLQINSTATANAQLLDFIADTFGGYRSAARSVTYGTVTTTTTESVGPKYLVQINSCESCRWIGGEMGDGGYYGVYLTPQAGHPLLHVSFTGGVHFDGSRIADVGFSSAGGGVAADVLFDGDFFDGEFTSLSAVKIPAATGPSWLRFSNSTVLAYASTCLDIQGGFNVALSGNNVRGCNGYGGFSAAETASGVYLNNFGGSLQNVTIMENIIGGGVSGEAYGANNHMLAALSTGSTIGDMFSVCGNSLPYNTGAATGTAADLAGQCFQAINGAVSNWGAYPTVYAGLSACGSGNAGATALVTDSSTATWGASIAGGGANTVRAWCNGSAWTVLGK